MEDLLQRDLGRMLIPGNKAQTISVFTGPGGCGKSVLVSIVERLIGTEKVAYLRSDKLNGRFETHGLQGKTLAVGKDVKPNYLSNDGAAMIKSLTGGDKIESEKKYGGKFELTGNLYVVITANSRLPIKLTGDASAWRRRLVYYNFKRETPITDVKGEGPDNGIFQDRRYMLQALQYGLNTISIIDSISPLRFHSQGKQMIVMPVRPESAVSQPPAEPKPRLNPNPEPPPERKPTMPEEPPHTPTNGTKTTIEEAIDLTLKLRDNYSQGLNIARDLNAKLKGINREQRTSARESSSLRSTLRSLQSLKL